MPVEIEYEIATECVFLQGEREEGEEGEDGCGHIIYTGGVLRSLDAVILYDVLKYCPCNAVSILMSTNKFLDRDCCQVAQTQVSLSLVKMINYKLLSDSFLFISGHCYQCIQVQYRGRG